MFRFEQYLLINGRYIYYWSIQYYKTNVSFLLLKKQDLSIRLIGVHFSSSLHLDYVKNLVVLFLLMQTFWTRSKNFRRVFETQNNH